jgi:DNA-directed RNA polymerase subunit M/transcription elongation factor TFIIS
VWPKVTCPKCGEEMLQYLTLQERVDVAVAKGTFLMTIRSYCQNKIRLSARTFEPVLLVGDGNV